MSKETKVIIGAKGSGKTTKLIKESALTGRHILVSNYRRADILSALAGHMGVFIPYPITLEEWLKFPARFEGSSIYKDGILIDDVDEVLKELLSPVEIKTVTLTSPQIESIPKEPKQYWIFKIINAIKNLPQKSQQEEKDSHEDMGDNIHAE